MKRSVSLFIFSSGYHWSNVQSHSGTGSRTAEQTPTIFSSGCPAGLTARSTSVSLYAITEQVTLKLFSIFIILKFKKICFIGHFLLRHNLWRFHAFLLCLQFLQLCTEYADQNWPGDQCNIVLLWLDPSAKTKLNSSWLMTRNRFLEPWYFALSLFLCFVACSRFFYLVFLFSRAQVGIIHSDDAQSVAITQALNASIYMHAGEGPIDDPELLAWATRLAASRSQAQNFETIRGPGTGILDNFPLCVRVVVLTFLSCILVLLCFCFCFFIFPSFALLLFSFFVYYFHFHSWMYHRHVASFLFLFWKHFLLRFCSHQVRGCHQWTQIKKHAAKTLARTVAVLQFEFAWAAASNRRVGLHLQRLWHAYLHLHCDHWCVLFQFSLNFKS